MCLFLLGFTQILENLFCVAREGTLYPLLRRLEAQGLLKSEWDTGGTRPRKYYVLSEEGVKALPQLENVWREISSAVGNILSGSPLELTEADTQ